MEEVLFCFFIRNAIAVHARAGTGLELHSIKAGQAQAPRVLGGNGVDPQPEKRMGARLETSHYLRVGACNICKKPSVAHAGELCLLFRRGEPR